MCAEEACTYACDVSRGLLCPDGYECATRDDGANYLCWALPEESGGCRAGGAGGGALAALALVGLLGRRRRR